MAFLKLRRRYGLSEYSAHKHSSLVRACWIRGHLDANTAQKIATGAWRAVEQYMFGQRRRPGSVAAGSCARSRARRPTSGSAC